MNNIDTFDNLNKQKKCCLIKKEYSPNNSSMYNGDFKYNYNALYDDACNINLYEQTSNQQLFIDGENNWNNNLCKEENDKVGSCRLNNKECVDFLQKEDCDKYYMNWSNKSCHNPIPFVFSDSIVKPPSLENIDSTALTYDKINISLNDMFKVSNKQMIDITNQYSIKNNESINILV